jgi:hypothetical protein
MRRDYYVACSPAGQQSVESFLDRSDKRKEVLHILYYLWFMLDRRHVRPYRSSLLLNVRARSDGIQKTASQSHAYNDIEPTISDLEPRRYWRQTCPVHASIVFGCHSSPHIYVFMCMSMSLYLILINTYIYIQTYYVSNGCEIPLTLTPLKYIYREGFTESRYISILRERN